MKPWEDPNSPWKTEAAFDAYIRGMLRKGWSRYPLKNLYLKQKRYRAPIGRHGKEIWAADCEICNERFPQSKLQVDHIQPAGSLRGEGGIDGFIERLFPTQAGMQLACKACHDIKTLSEKLSISFEAAKIEKEVIAIMKMKAEDQIQWLTQHKVENTAKNSHQRRELVRQHITKCK